MRSRPTKALEVAVDSIVAAGNDAQRDRMIRRLRVSEKEGLLPGLAALFARRKRDRWLLPSILHTLHKAGERGAKDALRPLLTDDVDGVRSSAAEVVAVNRWGDDFLDEIRALILLETRKGNRSGALGGGLGALRTAKSPAVTPMLLALARSPRTASAVWYGALLDVLADRRAPKARPIFEKVAKARSASDHARFMSLVGLAKLGDRKALDGLRHGLDAPDVMDARVAALALNELIGTTRAMTRPQFDRLGKWYDTHAAEVETRFRKKRRGSAA